ncbi:uncharacterized protein LOC132169139 [Corylus avellana]|uniref:uncharacterized protein LOC132169139 n=1 Tax=Corylus avellana TaxID=13451 RepID=UPI00286D61DA|nr:uncharacterized protein LOC132169139 [Corylus avellana]
MEHKIDRLSELPDPILEHILSFIPMKQIIQFSILSKTWEKVWSLFPIPEFKQHLFTLKVHTRKVLPNEKEEVEIQRKKQEFKNFVERCLLCRYRRRLTIDNFRLHMMLLDESDCALVNRWIGYAIECNVKELNLYVWINQKRYELPKKKYELPESVLAAKSITKLQLSRCKLKSFYSDINLSSLNKLVLEITVENQVVQSLIDGCRDMEEMTFTSCDGLKSIRVSGHSKLKAIELLQNSELESVDIEASNLESLVFRLTRPCQINLGKCENLKKLSLTSCNITDKWLYDVLSKHPLIDCLDLRLCDMLKMIKISSRRMKSLTFVVCCNLVEVDIVAPNLHRFEYIGDAISFSLNSSSLSEVSLTLFDALDAGMIESLAKLSQPKLLTWSGFDAESVITAKELREILPSPLYNVKQLKLEACSIPTRQIHELVDVLLWICPLMDILFIEWQYQGTIDNISFKFTYENPIYKLKSPSCCNLLPVLCWRHCLKTINIENLSGSIEEETLKKYFFENAEMLESFHYLKGSTLPDQEL